MDEDSRQTLQSVLELSEENNKMLHKLRGAQRREAVWRALKFIVIIGIALGSFYYIEPYLNKVMDLYDSIVGVEQKISNNPLKSLLEN